jgi:hypothetical protein
MTRTMHGVMLTVLLLFALSTIAGAQGLYWESTMTSSQSTTGDSSQTYYMPKMFKIVQVREQQVMLFRLDREMMYTINPQEKTYSEITFAEVERQMNAMSKQLDEKMADMKKKMENLPPEQRKQLESQMGLFMKSDDPKQKAEVVNTGEKRTISGYPATKYVAKKGEKIVMAVWVTKEIKGWGEMKSDFEQFSGRMTSLSRITDGISEAYRKVEGFPVQTEIGGMTNTVNKVERRSIPLSQFEIPAGYKKVDRNAGAGREE